VKGVRVGWGKGGKGRVGEGGRNDPKIISHVCTYELNKNFFKKSGSHRVR
jgi:hypothetical protein